MNIIEENEKFCQHNFLYTYQFELNVNCLINWQYISSRRTSYGNITWINGHFLVAFGLKSECFYEIINSRVNKTPCSLSLLNFIVMSVKFNVIVLRVYTYPIGQLYIKESVPNPLPKTLENGLFPLFVSNFPQLRRFLNEAFQLTSSKAGPNISSVNWILVTVLFPASSPM
jgi:hypothetical protein